MARAAAFALHTGFRDENYNFNADKKNGMYIGTKLTTLLVCIAALASCSLNRRISKAADALLLGDTVLLNAHTGISIYDPAAGKYLYNYQGDRYFIPASNTKLFTCYAAMKYLGDSLTGLEYRDFDTAIALRFTGDPTLLHPDFNSHPVLDFLKAEKRKLYADPPTYWKEEALGFGWAWDDYNSSYMAERNPLPIYGNTVTYHLDSLYFTGSYMAKAYWRSTPRWFTQFTDSAIVLPAVLRAKLPVGDTARWHSALKRFSLSRHREANTLDRNWGGAVFTRDELPFVTGINQTALALLAAEQGVTIRESASGADEPLRPGLPAAAIIHTVKSQRTDTVLKYMMHRSDNLYAEQLLLMTAYLRLGMMKTGSIIDTLLKTDLAGLPRRPRWVDGCGLSRYNLFTPQDFVFILAKMQREFGMERLQAILPTGGEGTISSYYQALQGRIFVKTGTLSNNCALSGFIRTNKGKWLIFSILANHYPSGATPVRRAVERFLTRLSAMD